MNLKFTRKLIIKVQSGYNSGIIFVIFPVSLAEVLSCHFEPTKKKVITDKQLIDKMAQEKDVNKQNISNEDIFNLLNKSIHQNNEMRKEIKAEIMELRREIQGSNETIREEKIGSS